jgi:hypothetical protein
MRDRIMGEFVEIGDDLLEAIVGGDAGGPPREGSGGGGGEIH